MGGEQLMTNQDICDQMAGQLTVSIVDEYSYHLEAFDGELTEEQFDMLDGANIQVIVTPASN